MHLYNKEQAIKRMNQFGQHHRPFVFIINYLQDASYIEEVAAVDSTELLYNLNGFTNQATSTEKYTPSFSAKPANSIHWQPSAESFYSYQRSFNIVRQNILAGNSFLTNLTCRTPVDTNLTLKDIYSIPSAAQLLMNDPKEAAEHATIVDLIRNDLSMVANQVFVSRYRYIDTLQTNQGAILQTSSEIQGILPENYPEHLGELIFRLLPAGSITGAPKKKTMQIIREAETYDRGFYTGIMGYSDGINLDSAVMIRFVEQEGEKMYFKSGGGITCQSDAESEYNEMKQKIYVPIY